MSLPTALAHASALSPTCKIQVLLADNHVSVLRSAPPFCVLVERIISILGIGLIKPFNMPVIGRNPTPQL